MSVIGLDTETFYEKKVYGVEILGADRYVRDPRFDCYMVSVCDGETTWAGHPRDFNWNAVEGQALASHNAYFDQAVRDGMEAKGLPVARRSDITAWHCTANLAAYVTEGVRALAESVKVLYDQELDKGMRNYMNGKTWADAVKEGKDKQLTEYARHDAYWCWRIWNDFNMKWPEHEQKLSELTIEQGKHGIQVDTPKLESYLGRVQEHLFNVEQALPWRKTAKPTSTKAIAEECARAGIPAPPVKDDDEEGFIKWEAEFSPRFPWIQAVTDWRSYNKLLVTLKVIKARLREDDTIECPLKYFGAHTGRWQGESGLNFQNLRKDAIDAAGIKVDMRSLFTPRPGWKMIICDLAQIEPRVLNWLAGNQELLDAIRDGFSYYEAYAGLYKNWKGEKGSIKKSLGGEAYTKLKNEALGLGYQMGAERYIDYAHVTQEEAEAVVTEFRARNKHIVSLWGELDRGFKRSVKKTFEVGLPSGRTMHYPRVGRGMKIFKGKDGKIKKDFGMFADMCKMGKYRRVSLYGGMLTENLVQATARDVFAFHLLELHRAGLRVLFTCHDEAVLEVPMHVTAKDVEAIMSRTPPWLEGCPIAAEAHEAKYFCK